MALKRTWTLKFLLRTRRVGSWRGWKFFSEQKSKRNAARTSVHAAILQVRSTLEASRITSQHRRFGDVFQRRENANANVASIRANFQHQVGSLMCPFPNKITESKAIFFSSRSKLRKKNVQISWLCHLASQAKLAYVQHDFSLYVEKNTH